MKTLAINGGRPVSKHKIPIAKPVFSEKVLSDISQVLKSGLLCQGPKTEKFEDEFKKKVGAKYAYSVSSGTAALHVSFMSILKPNDEVIVPAFTFIATASTVALSKGKPVFADINRNTLMIDHEDVKEKITSKTKAIAPVHLFGNAANMETLMKIAEDHNLYLVNDAAQAHGTEINGKDVGSYEHLNSYSFYPTKIITTGEGGIVTTNNKEFCEKGKKLRNHGQESRYHHLFVAPNYRMTEIAAVIGLNQLRNLDEFIKKRRHNAEILTEGIRGISGIEPQKKEKGVSHSYSYYTVIMDLEEFKCNRDEFVRTLKAENIECRVYYPSTLLKQPALKKYAEKASCPIADEISNRVFSIPIHPELTREDLRKILEALERASNYFAK